MEGETEETVAHAFRQVLNLHEPIGAMSDFFASGGDSMSAIHLQMMLREKGLSLPVSQMMHDSTVRGMAAACRRIEAEAPLPQDNRQQELSNEELQLVSDDFTSRGERLGPTYPLLPVQEGILLHVTSHPGEPDFGDVIRFSLRVLPTEEQLRRTLHLMALKHEDLRTAIIYSHVSHPCQAIVEGREPYLAMMDVTGETDQEAALSALQRRIECHYYDLQHKPLFGMVCVKTGAASCQMMLIHHHIISDGWGESILIADLLQTLEAVINGSPIQEHSGPKGLYERYVRERVQRDQSEAISYWRRLLDGYDTRAIVPYSEVSSDVSEASMPDVCSLDIDADEMARLKQFCSQQAVTPNTVVELALGIVLAQCNDREDAVFGKVVSGRDNTVVDVSQMTALCINLIPVRIDARCQKTVSRALRAVRSQAAESNAHDFCAMSQFLPPHLMGSNMLENIMGGRLLQTIINFHNESTAGEEPLPLGYEELYMDAENFNELFLNVFTDNDLQMTLELSYAPTLYDLPTAQRVLQHIKRLMLGMVADADQTIAMLLSHLRMAVRCFGTTKRCFTSF